MLENLMAAANRPYLNIGIFDSGLGGLGVFKELQKEMGLLNRPQGFVTHYISDLAFCPYGEKSQEQIIERCKELSEILLDQGAQLLVVACNTATALAIDQLRKIYPVPFVGVEPYLSYINQHLKKNDRPFRPVVLLTKASASSERFQQLKQKFHLTPEQCQVFPCEGLAWLIECHIHQRAGSFFQENLERILSPLKDRGFTHAILGCTHYPYVAPQIEKFLGLTCVAPETHVAKRILHLLEKMLPTPRIPTSSSFPYASTPIPHLHIGVTRHDPDLEIKLRTILHELP